MVRQQPEGLMMRYQPFGEQSQDEDTDEAPTFKLPPVVSAERSSRALKPSADNDRPSPSKAPMKERKSLKTAKLTSGVSEALTLSQESISSKPVESIRSEKQLNHRVSSGPKPSETSEEQAKRRADKKRKRETTDGEPSHTSDQREEYSKSTTYQGKRMAANGIDQTSLDAATPKKKRKKRKSEATDA
ncbi:MAG: hypothetical protein L6R38_005207 [Xanthoria sp. 2 TBL-2021]|nr:MAG: hypothetical protein L6R38_005207 [Xanthoria sp. 2 TBL-2021]